MSPVFLPQPNPRAGARRVPRTALSLPPGVPLPSGRAAVARVRAFQHHRGRRLPEAAAERLLPEYRRGAAGAPRERSLLPAQVGRRHHRPEQGAGAAGGAAALGARRRSDRRRPLRTRGRLRAGHYPRHGGHELRRGTAAGWRAAVHHRVRDRVGAAGGASRDRGTHSRRRRRLHRPHRQGRHAYGRTGERRRAPRSRLLRRRRRRRHRDRRQLGAGQAQPRFFPGRGAAAPPRAGGGGDRPAGAIAGIAAGSRGAGSRRPRRREHDQRHPPADHRARDRSARLRAGRLRRRRTAARRRHRREVGDPPGGGAPAPRLVLGVRSRPRPAARGAGADVGGA